MDLTDLLNQLAEQNLSGISFLCAYGITWLACAIFWKRASQRTSAYATLFQGLVAFPVAMGLSYLIGAIGQDRPVPDEISTLSIFIGTSQLLGLPFLIFLVVKQQYRLVPYAFAVICSMHFILYSWLYQTPLYIIMAVLISVLTTALMLASREQNERVTPIRVCVLTGALLLATAVAFLAIHLL